MEIQEEGVEGGSAQSRRCQNRARKSSEQVRNAAWTKREDKVKLHFNAMLWIGDQDRLSISMPIYIRIRILFQV